MKRSQDSLEENECSSSDGEQPLLTSGTRMEEPTPEQHSVERDIIYILISITFVAPLTPSLFRKYITGGGKWIPRLNCFAAGIFFGITFFHILPEAFSNTQRLFENSDVMTALKVTCGMFTVGFLLLLWIGISFLLMISYPRSDRLWFSKYHDATDNHNHQTNTHSHHETHRTPRLEDSILAFDSDDGLEMSEGENNEVVFPTENKSKRAIAIGTLAAFSFHSFLEGIAIGSERPNLELLGLIIVFSFHKVITSITHSRGSRWSCCHHSLDEGRLQRSSLLGTDHWILDDDSHGTYLSFLSHAPWRSSHSFLGIS